MVEGQARKLGAFYLLCLPGAWFGLGLTSTLAGFVGSSRAALAVVLGWMEFLCLIAVALMLLLFRRPPGLACLLSNLVLTLWASSWIALLCTVSPQLWGLQPADWLVLLANTLATLLMLVWAFQVTNGTQKVTPCWLSLGAGLSLAAVAGVSAWSTEHPAFLIWSPTSGGILDFAQAKIWCGLALLGGLALALASLFELRRLARPLAGGLALLLLLLAWPAGQANGTMAPTQLHLLLGGPLLFASLFGDWEMGESRLVEEPEGHARPGAGGRWGLWILLLLPLFCASVWMRVDFDQLFLCFDGDRLAKMEEELNSTRERLGEVDTARRYIERARADQARLEKEVEALRVEVQKLERAR